MDPNVIDKHLNYLLGVIRGLAVASGSSNGTVDALAEDCLNSAQAIKEQVKKGTPEKST